MIVEGLTGKIQGWSIVCYGPEALLKMTWAAVDPLRHSLCQLDGCDNQRYGAISSLQVKLGLFFESTSNPERSLW